MESNRLSWRFDISGFQPATYHAADFLGGARGEFIAAKIKITQILGETDEVAQFFQAKIDP